MISILTGDIVGSRDLPAKDRTTLHSKLRAAAEHAGLGENFEVFRGDSWQCLCDPLHEVFKRAILLRAYLLGKYEIDTRVSIGIGSVESLNLDNISLSQGEAFEMSGLGLTKMPNERRLALGLGKNVCGQDTPIFTAACMLLDAATSNWTSKQALAVALTHIDANQYELAKKFTPPISAQAYGKHLAKAQWKLIKQALHSIELGLRQTISPEKSKLSKK